MTPTKTALIIGAGPAGLTAAYELLDKTDIKPIVFEMSGDIGGLSKTVVYRGNRMDIGGHRFFSKSRRITDWWLNLLPLQGSPARDDLVLGRLTWASGQRLRRDIASRKTVALPAPDPEREDRVMLQRDRVSRIFYSDKFFDYPIRLDANLLLNLGINRITRIGFSYLHAQLFPRKKELSLEDFFINRFGSELYRIFFKDYTEKVWGMPCREIQPDWGAQRVKGLSVARTLTHAARNLMGKGGSADVRRVETSLVERFFYPKLGPGQMWEEVANAVTAHGGRVLKQHKVIGLRAERGRIIEALIKDECTGHVISQRADYFFSTMPVKDLVESLRPSPPHSVATVASQLIYRDFITVGVLVKALKIANTTNRKTVNNIIPDNWIYVQEPNVKMGRIQVFNNWSPYLVSDSSTVWLGLEYFANEGDSLWSMTDGEMIEFVVGELAKIHMVDRRDVLDATVIKMPKTYPTYAGSFWQFPVVKRYLDGFENLFLIGRNGMHRYNNMDHSMLTAMVAVENIRANVSDKENIWQVNAEEDYHEEQ